MSLRKNIGCTDCNHADVIMDALQQPTPIPTGTVARKVIRIGAAEPSLSNDAAGVIIAGGLLAGAMMYKNGVIGKKKKRSMLPLVLIGGGALAYYLYTQQNQTPASYLIKKFAGTPVANIVPQMSAGDVQTLYDYDTKYLSKGIVLNRTDDPKLFDDMQRIREWFAANYPGFSIGRYI